jgi:hypothetical protein
LTLLTVPVRTVRTDTCQSVQLTWQRPYSDVAASGDDTWQVRTGDVAAPGDDTWQYDPYRTRGSTGGDTCQAFLAFSARTWTNPGVTRVTTGRVTRGTDDVSIVRR